jgi:membrane protease YdiL (CAAX protease family)
MHEPAPIPPPDMEAASAAGPTFAPELRGFGPLGLLSLVGILLGNVLFVPLSALLVLLWAWNSRTPWSEIGYVRPKSWPRTVVLGVALGVAFKIGMKVIVMPLLGAPPVNQAYHSLAGNRAALPGAMYMLTVGAGFGEETVFRGFLFERLGKLLGTTRGAKLLTVALTTIAFASAHWSNQGWPGVEQALFTGFVFGAILARTGSVFLPMIMHAAFDLTALWMIFGSFETRIAHLVFK